MDESVIQHVMKRLANATLATDPYPHFHVTDIFPEDFYQEILDHLPEVNQFQSIAESGFVTQGAYKQRLILPLRQEELSRLPFNLFLFWGQFMNALNSDVWLSFLVKNYEQHIKQRFGDHSEKVYFSSTADLVCDQSNYSIGPHTDHSIRVLTLLFYLPRSRELAHLGTSIYRPINPSFECEGSGHYSFRRFVKLQTIPFTPNSVFGFIRSNRSFHGVEPITDKKVERNLLSYYMQWNRKSDETKSANSP